MARPQPTARVGTTADAILAVLAYASGCPRPSACDTTMIEHHALICRRQNLHPRGSLSFFPIARPLHRTLAVHG